MESYLLQLRSNWRIDPVRIYMFDCQDASVRDETE